MYCRLSLAVPAGIRRQGDGGPKGVSSQGQLLGKEGGEWSPKKVNPETESCLQASIAQTQKKRRLLSILQSRARGGAQSRMGGEYSGRETFGSKDKRFEGRGRKAN